MSASRERTALPRRPLVWLPGVACVDAYGPAAQPARVWVGRAAGWRQRPSGADDRAPGGDVVEKRALTPAVCAAVGLVLPEDRIDAAEFPHVHRAALAADLVCVPEPKRTALVARGVRVYTVWYSRGAEGYLTLRARGGDVEAVELNGILWDYLDAHLARVRATQGEKAVQVAFDATSDCLVDRILRAATGGVLTELAVELALELGPFPRSVPRTRRAPEVLRAELAAWNAWLGHVYALAEPYAEAAHELAAAVRAAGAGGDAVRVPVYGAVRRITLAATEVTVPENPYTSVSTPARGPRTLRLPAYDEFVVDGDVETWWPAARRTTPSSARGGGGGPSWEAVAAKLGALATRAWGPNLAVTATLALTCVIAAVLWLLLRRG